MESFSQFEYLDTIARVQAKLARARERRLRSKLARLATQGKSKVYLSLAFFIDQLGKKRLCSPLDLS